MSESKKMVQKRSGVMVKIFGSLFLVALLSQCSAEPDGQGMCSLSCANSIFGSSEYRIVPTIEELALTCTEPGPFANAITLNFRVFAEADSGQGGDPMEVPVRNIAFTPNVIGGAAARTHEELMAVPTGGGAPAPRRGQFAGLWTTQAEWCADSCGMMSVEVFPVCPSPGKTSALTVQLNSGSAVSEPYQIEIENP